MQHSLDSSSVTLRLDMVLAAYNRKMQALLLQKQQMKETRISRLTSIKCHKDNIWFSKRRTLTIDEAINEWDNGENTNVSDYGSFPIMDIPRYDLEIELEEVNVIIKSLEHLQANTAVTLSISDLSKISEWITKK